MPGTVLGPGLQQCAGPTKALSCGAYAPVRKTSRIQMEKWIMSDSRKCYGIKYSKAREYE